MKKRIIILVIIDLEKPSRCLEVAPMFLLKLALLFPFLCSPQ